MRGKGLILFRYSNFGALPLFKFDFITTRGCFKNNAVCNFMFSALALSHENLAEILIFRYDYLIRTKKGLASESEYPYGNKIFFKVKKVFRFL